MLIPLNPYMAAGFPYVAAGFPYMAAGFPGASIMRGKSYTLVDAMIE
jgi:hypothetical protein